MAKTAAQEFLDRVLATVPEEKKAEVQSLYSRAADEIAASQTTLEEQTAQVRATAEKQNQWWTTHKDDVAELAELKKRGGGGGSGLTPEEVTKQLGDLKDDVMSNGLALITAATTISAAHYKEFGEALDMRALAQEAIKANKTLDAYYNEKVAPVRQERAAADLTAKLAEAEARGKKAGIEETTQTLGNRQMPFPGHSTAPTTLSGLRKPAEGTAPPNVLADAVATANEVAARSAG